ncbi:hypothetical protein Maq22A_c22080 [Methylobacterium aquaticum]|uniref:Uncharacterized protein n=1 Tax=Methylobacterium aquaticum TaxID=270351 RepID=A0A0C6FQ37_9HYPH|nr:hypothetical protein Maq22A_c22080 [Methylobacterium aquaticum]
MSLPREGSRTVREGIVVAEAMDWCRSPTVIVPYTIDTHHQGGGSEHRRQRAPDRRALARAGLADPAVLRRRTRRGRGRDVRDAGGGMRAEDMVVERAGGRAPPWYATTTSGG